MEDKIKVLESRVKTLEVIMLVISAALLANLIIGTI